MTDPALSDLPGHLQNPARSRRPTWLTTLVGDLPITATLTTETPDVPVGSPLDALTFPWFTLDGRPLPPGLPGILPVELGAARPGDQPGTWTVTLHGTLQVFRTLSAPARNADEARAAALNAAPAGTDTSGPWRDLTGTALSGTPDSVRLLLGDGACRRTDRDARPG